MMLRPDVLLLDEPFAAIDPITRQDIHAQLQEIMHEVPITALLVTHDMREAMELAQRIVVLSEGGVSVDAEVAVLEAQHPGEEPETILKGILGDVAK
jgi:ABC-type nitrate/sulfonate/bicarbonate transport system ATPase subunit